MRAWYWGSRVSAVAMALLCLGGLTPAAVAGPAHEAACVAGQALENMDVRRSNDRNRTAWQAHVNGPLKAVRRAAVDSLAEEVDGLVVHFAPLTGTPRHVYARGAFLTAPAAGGDPAAIVGEFVQANPSLFRISPMAFDASRVERHAVTAHNGMTSLILNQTHDGADVFGAELRAAVTADGELVSISSTFLAPPQGGFLIQPAALTGPEAVRRAAELLGATLPGVPTIRREQSGWSMYGRPRGVQRDLCSRFTYFPITPEELAPAYIVFIGLNGESRYLMVIDARDGGLLLRINVTLHADTATYRVYADPLTGIPLSNPRPMLPGPEAPDGLEPSEASRSLITIDMLDPIASPEGWLPAGEERTRGNNALVYADLSGDNHPDPNDFVIGVGRVFDFPLDLAQNPNDYLDASLTQAFYVANWWHDRMHQLGFTEEFANFQDNNFGRGGQDGDPIRIELHTPDILNNAAFFFMPDGISPTVRVFRWVFSTPNREGALDSTLMIHELAHGTVTRLMGVLGSVGLGFNQSHAMNEGWADFYALSMLSDPTSDPAGSYPVAGYMARDFNGAVDNYYFGIRRFPTSTSHAKSPLTYADIDPAQYGYPPSVPISPYVPNTSPGSVHADGEIWCNALWECRANLIARYGAAGNEVMLQLVTDGLKLTPGDSSFVEARDAILLADLVNTGGIHWPELWDGFARRGLGSEARSAGETGVGVTESFVVPGEPFVRFISRPSIAEQLATLPQVRVAVASGPGPQAAAVDLMVSINGGPMTQHPMPLVSAPNVYGMAIPGLNCGDQANWYVRATTAGGSAFLPAQAPVNTFVLYVGGALDMIFVDTFETDRGWTTGDPNIPPPGANFERGIPEGTFFQPGFDSADPGDQCYFTGLVFNPVGGTIDGKATLISPSFDATGFDDLFIRYERWWGDFRAIDSRYYWESQVSNNDGITWTRMERVFRNVNRWTERTLRVNDYLPLTDTMRFRFVASGSLLGEAGVDHVRLFTLDCSPCPGDADGDREVGLSDLLLVLANFGAPCDETCPGDVDGDWVVGLSDLLLVLSNFGTDCDG